MRKWKKITHPDLSEEGEISEILVDAKSGVFAGLEDGVTDQRLKTVFEKLARKLAAE